MADKIRAKIKAKRAVGIGVVILKKDDEWEGYIDPNKLETLVREGIVDAIRGGQDVKADESPVEKPKAKGGKR
jgi:hypothetical protein